MSIEATLEETAAQAKAWRAVIDALLAHNPNTLAGFNRSGIDLAVAEITRLQSYDTAPKYLPLPDRNPTMINPFRSRLAYRELTDAEIERVEQIKDAAQTLYMLLDSKTNWNDNDRAATMARYFALSRTALEESVLWATKAVTT